MTDVFADLRSEIGRRERRSASIQQIVTKLDAALAIARGIGDQRLIMALEEALEGAKRSYEGDPFDE